MKPKPTTYRDTIEKVMERIDDAMDATVFRMDGDTELDLDGILVSLAEARVYAIKARTMAISADMFIISVEDDQPRVYADEVKTRGAELEEMWDASKPKKLPKLKPQGHSKDAKPKYKPGISKLMKPPINFDCPRCHAQHGTYCFKFDGPGANPVLTNERNDGNYFHTDRQVLSRAYNDGVRKKNILQ
jgi:hypothetical protein